MGESACVMYPVPVIPTEAIEGEPLRGLYDSISFGQFAQESLSWEKWSTFSHKKYVEEAERCSKPGSVAEKKAFFEAHYKKTKSMKAAALLEDTGNGELKDQTQDSTLYDGGLNLASKKEENDPRKDGGGGFAAENVKLNELRRDPREQKQDVQMETPSTKDLAGSLTSSLDKPLQKKRTSFVKFMCGSGSSPKTKESVQKRKEDKAETKKRSWSSCFCIGAGQLEDRPKLPTKLPLFPRSP